MPKIEEPLDQPQVMEVHVINRNDFTIRDMFDSTEFVFPQDQPVKVPPDAAFHIFGWFPEWQDEHGVVHRPDPAKMRLHVMRRFGWNTPAMAGGPGDVFYENIKIKPVMYRMVPVAEPEEDEAKPVNPPKPNKVMQAVAESQARHAAQ